MQSNDWMSAVLEHRAPMEPRPTELAPRRMQLQDVQVVLLDVYGTLVISGSGDVGTADESEPADQVIAACAAQLGMEDPSSLPTMTEIKSAITTLNQASRSEGNPKPEIEILSVWRMVLQQHGRDDLTHDPAAVCRLACLVEARLNPTWPMPGAADALHQLHAAGTRLGIVSNAQVFTIPIVEDLIGDRLESRFDLNLCYFSNRFRASKPGPLMFERVRAELGRLGYAAHQAVYIGNDMLNDVWAASQVGLRTVLFAGDARSLRQRGDHASCSALSADVVLTHWNQLVDCLPERAMRARL
ncbi:MAG: HAD family hydrolase [Planctomycetota bacterium]